MPKLPEYQYTGPVDCTVTPDLSKLRDKSVIVTGGADGIGEFIVRAFVAAGAFVTIGDVKVEKGQSLAAELGSACFVECDIRNWDQQVAVFETAIKRSPGKSCDIVIANAGISRAFNDSLWPLGDPKAPPAKPDLELVDINLIGTLYTFKLATHYFRAQPDDDDRDRCLLITTSLAAYVEAPGNWEYTCSKAGLRGLMKVFRTHGWQQGIRINTVAPYFVKSAIRTLEKEQYLESKGVTWALPEDVGAAMIRVASDRNVNGHSFMVVPRDMAKEGFLDTEQDDLQGAPEHYRHMQRVSVQVVPIRWEEGVQVPK